MKKCFPDSTSDCSSLSTFRVKHVFRICQNFVSELLFVLKNCRYWHPTLQGFHVPSISSEVLALGDDVCVVLLSGLLLFFSFFFSL